MGEPETGRISSAASNPPDPGGTIVYGPDSSTFTGCYLFHQNTQTWEHVDPTFVLRLPDTDGASYGFSDGYTLPFPTPWVSNQDAGMLIPGSNPAQEMGLGCSPNPTGKDCAYEPKVYTYEQKLLTNVAGMVSHEFFVYQLTPNPPGIKVPNPKAYAVGTKQFYYNGTTNYNTVDAMASVIANYGTPQRVQAQPANCAYVLQQNASGALVTSGFHAQVAQVHDPINWPD